MKIKTTSFQEQWINSNDKYDFLQNLKLNNRLYALFACACVRQIWNNLTDQRSKDAIIITELFVDGKATRKEFVKAKKAAYNAANAAWDAYSAANVAANAAHSAANATYAANAANAANATTAYAAYYATDTVNADNEREMIIIQGKLLESIVQPNLQYNKEWSTSTVKLLTQQIYEQQDWSLLPILADALQDNNCTNDELLFELRNGNLWCKGNRLLDEILVLTNKREFL